MTEKVNIVNTDDLPEGEYLILSLKHSPADGYALWWGPRNAGYVTDINEAGRYTLAAINADNSYYNNGDSTKAILLADAMKIAKVKHVALWPMAKRQLGA